MAFAPNASTCECLKEFRKARKETSAVERLSGASYVSWCNSSPGLAVCAPVNRLVISFSASFTLYLRLVSFHRMFFFFLSGTGSLPYRLAFAFLLYQLVYPGLLLPCFESPLLLAFDCSSFRDSHESLGSIFALHCPD